MRRQTFIGIMLVYCHQICMWTTIDVSNCVSKYANLWDFKIRKCGLWVKRYHSPKSANNLLQYSIASVIYIFLHFFLEVHFQIGKAIKISHTVTFLKSKKKSPKCELVLTHKETPLTCYTYRNSFCHSFGSCTSKIKLLADLISPWLADCCLFTVSLLLCTYISSISSSLRKDASPIGLGSTFTISFNFNYLPKGLVFKFAHIVG